MKIIEYQKILKNLLNSHKSKPYLRENEGWVYIGFPNSKFKFNSIEEKKEFIYYLSLFIAFDLIIYSSFREHYPKIKEVFKIPKFEYGLTNTFIYPEKIIDYFKIGINKKIFEKCYLDYKNYVDDELNKNNIKLNIKTIESEILKDKDLNKGIFGKAFFEIIKEKNK